MADKTRATPSTPTPATTAVPTLVASGVGVGGTSWNVLIHVLQPHVVNDQPAEKPALTLAVPRQLARALYVLLGDVLDRLDEREGSLELPKSFVKTHTAATEPPPRLAKKSAKNLR